MNIIFKRLERIEGEKADGTVWVAYKIHGTKLEDGSPWKSTNIFDNAFNKDFIGDLSALDVGAKVNVIHSKNKQGYMTPTELGDVSANPTSAGSTKEKDSPKNIGKVSSWNGRTGEAYDRSSAIYLALDILKFNKEKDTPSSSIDMFELHALANTIYEYIHNGKPVSEPLDAPEF